MLRGMSSSVDLQPTQVCVYALTHVYIHAYRNTYKKDENIV